MTNHKVRHEPFYSKGIIFNERKTTKQMVLEVLILLILFIKSLYNKIPHSLIIKKQIH